MNRLILVSIRTVMVALALASLPLGSRPIQAQQTVIRGFADVTGSSSTRRDAPTSFGLGQFDLYITSQLSDRISFLGETVFEYDDGFIVDVERVVVSFDVNQMFRIGVGRHHTPIGYWNNIYHHGALIQPTIERPQMFRFEDEGGVLPIHGLGIQVSGRDISALHLGYDVLVGNGSGASVTQDDNASKAVTLALHSQITSALRIGASLYSDRIAAGTINLAGTPLSADVDARLAGAFVAFTGSDVELLAEYQRVSNRSVAGGQASNSDAAYVYLGRRFGDLVPYIRMDKVFTPPGDPYMSSSDFEQLLAGTRYDFAATTVLKAELSRRTFDGSPSSTHFTLQLAVGF